MHKIFGGNYDNPSYYLNKTFSFKLTKEGKKENILI